MISVEIEEHAAAQALADLALGDERDRAPPAHCPDQLQEELRERGRPVAERDDLRSPLGRSEHTLRVDIAARQQAQVAVAALDKLDAGDLRQPLRRRALELQLDPPLLRGASQSALRRQSRRCGRGR